MKYAEDTISQRCPVCGCVYKSNRKNQFEFECVGSDHKANADTNAAVNIKDRVGNEKLCVDFLKTTLDGYEYKDNVLKYGGCGDVLSYR